MHSEFASQAAAWFLQAASIAQAPHVLHDPVPSQPAALGPLAGLLGVLPDVPLDVLLGAATAATHAASLQTYPPLQSSSVWQPLFDPVSLSWHAIAPNEATRLRMATSGMVRLMG